MSLASSAERPGSDRWAQNHSEPQDGFGERSLLYATCHVDPGPVHAVDGVGPTTGLAYRYYTLYGLEVDASAAAPNDVFLYTMAASPCATGTRIGPPVGYTNLEVYLNSLFQ